MRGTCFPLLLAAVVCVHGAQVPFQALQHDEDLSWDKDPDVDATGNRIFTSVSELMQLWPGTVIVQGHSFSPSTIPVGTVFYHGRADEYVPTVPEWLAFDFEHAYRFSNGHLLTLVTKRALRVLNFDGLSAHMSTETQSIIMHGEVLPDSGRESTHVLAERLCTWGAANGIDGFIRMEGHFELIECSFADSFNLLSSLSVLPPDERTKDGGGRGPGGGRKVERPDGWIGSLPTESGQEVDVTGKWHDYAPGETRVRPQYNKFVTFYDPAVKSLVESRRDKPREQHNLQPLSKADAQMKLAELEEALALPWDEGSGIDWFSITHVVVERYGERLEVLAQTLSDNSSSLSAYESAFKARQQVLMMLTPHFTTADTPGADGAASKAWLTPVVERCASTHTRGLPTNLLTKQEVLIRGSVEDVMHQICRRLARMFYVAYDVEGNQLEVSSVVEAMQVELSDLMTWLDWTQVWVKCTPACSEEEICVVSSQGGGRRPGGGRGSGGPGGGGGGGGDRRHPKCVRKPNT